MTSPLYQLDAEMSESYANYVNEVTASFNPSQAIYQSVTTLNGQVVLVAAQVGANAVSVDTNNSDNPQNWTVIYDPLYPSPGMMWIFTPISSTNPWWNNSVNSGVMGVRMTTTKQVN